MATTYKTVQGDMWDSIAHKLAGTEEVTAQLIEANLDKSDIMVFSAGIELVVPEFNITPRMRNTIPRGRSEVIPIG